MIERINTHVFSITLDTDYLRFDENTWYRHNKRNDSYERIYDSEHIEFYFNKENES